MSLLHVLLYVNIKPFHGLICILQPIYTTNGRRASLPAIYHTDSVTAGHMEKSCLLSIHNYKFADTTTCALVSSCLILNTCCLTLKIMPGSI